MGGGRFLNKKSFYSYFKRGERRSSRSIIVAAVYFQRGRSVRNNLQAVVSPIALRERPIHCCRSHDFYYREWLKLTNLATLSPATFLLGRRRGRGLRFGEVHKRFVSVPSRIVCFYRAVSDFFRVTLPVQFVSEEGREANAPL